MKAKCFYAIVLAFLAASQATAKWSADSTEYDSFGRYRVGGYGEMVASGMGYGKSRFDRTTSGNTYERRGSIAIPRFVLAGDYKFSKHWALGAEIEFEAGGVGVETEMEASENSEYETEMEKGGEVALEQFHITYHLNNALNVRAGHQVLPVGLTNAHHEPILFFGTVRPESETVIIPSTWHETGLSIFGALGRGYSRLSYQAFVTAGLNADGFGRDHWVADGKQGLFETDNFTSPAYTFRLEYEGVPGLRVGASYYFCGDASANADKRYKYSSVDGGVGVNIFSADAQYLNRFVAARANVLWGEVENAKAVGGVSLSNKSQYHHKDMRKTAQNALAYGAEVGISLREVIGNPRVPVFYPFARYEYYNPQEKGDGGQSMDPRCKVSKWVGGLNWYALPNLVVKADYSTRKIGTSKVFGRSRYNRENEISIGVAYAGWFFKK